MTSINTRPRSPYTAELYCDFDSYAPAHFATIREARAWAEDFGALANKCVIRDAKGHEVALHMRDSSSNNWYRAQV